MLAHQLGQKTIILKTLQLHLYWLGNLVFIVRTVNVSTSVGKGEEKKKRKTNKNST